MFNFGAESFKGPEQGEKFKNAVERISGAVEDLCNGDLEQRLKNNQDTNS